MFDDEDLSLHQSQLKHRPVWAGFRSMSVFAFGSWNNGKCLWAISSRLFPMGFRPKTWANTSPNPEWTQICRTSCIRERCIDWLVLYLIQSILWRQEQHGVWPHKWKRPRNWNPHKISCLSLAVDALHSGWTTSPWGCHWGSTCWWTTNSYCKDCPQQWRHSFWLLRYGNSSGILWLWLTPNNNLNVHTGVALTCLTCLLFPCDTKAIGFLVIIFSGYMLPGGIQPNTFRKAYLTSWNIHNRSCLPTAMDTIHSRWATSTVDCHWGSSCNWTTNLCGVQDFSQWRHIIRLPRLGNCTRILWLFVGSNNKLNAFLVLLGKCWFGLHIFPDTAFI